MMAQEKRQLDEARQRLEGDLRKAKDEAEAEGRRLKEEHETLMRKVKDEKEAGEKKVAELHAEARSLEDKAILALRSGDEPLAREALKRKGRAERDAEETEKQAASAATSADEMKETLESVERKIDEIESRKSALAAQVRKARDTSSPGGGGSRFGDASAFSDLERMGGRIETLESEVEAHEVLDDPKRADVDARFRRLEKEAGGSKVDGIRMVGVQSGRDWTREMYAYSRERVKALESLKTKGVTDGDAWRVPPAVGKLRVPRPWPRCRGPSHFERRLRTPPR